jgi:hypothetical protein
MNRLPRQVIFAILLFLFLGMAAAILAFWLFDHPQAVAGAGSIIALLLGIFFVSYTAALWRYLRWRGRVRLSSTGAEPRADLKGTVYGLIPDREYQVVQSFTDYYGNTFEQGQRLRFKQRHFQPYHGGHTIIFAERPLYLQEDQNRDILENFSEYIAQVK